MKDSGEQEKRKVPVIEVDERQLRAHVSEVVRQSVEETLNSLLDAEADALCKARRYERNADRASTRAGITNGDFRQQPGRSGSRFPNCVRFLLKRPLLSVIAAGKVLWKKRLWKSIWPAYPSGKSRILPRRSGAAVSVRVPSAT